MLEGVNMWKLLSPTNSNRNWEAKTYRHSRATPSKLLWWWLIANSQLKGNVPLNKQRRWRRFFLEKSHLATLHNFMCVQLQILVQPFPAHLGASEFPYVETYMMKDEHRPAIHFGSTVILGKFEMLEVGRKTIGGFYPSLYNPAASR